MTSVAFLRLGSGRRRAQRRRRREAASLAFARRWWRRAKRLDKFLARRAPPLRFLVLGAAGLATLAAANLAWQVARKPSELLFPLDGVLAKTPAETWRDYGPLFRRYATATISAELLAALAQAESAGNPAARTYWRFQLSLDPFAIWAPASSAIGMFQMTDAAFAEARGACIRDHKVVEEGCRPGAFYFRVLPEDAIELASIYLDRNVAMILRRNAASRMGPAEKQDLAALIHLCGPGAAEAFLRAGLPVRPGARCGTHDAASYLARVKTLRRQFAALARKG
jgi:hypothetical protein